MENLISLASSDRTRTVAGVPQLQLVNRFFEENPVLNPQQASAIARPGLRKWLEVGDGPVRRLFSESGVFDNDLFVASGYNLYRVTALGTITDLGRITSNLTNRITMAATAPIGTLSESLFISTGGALYVYTENGFASNSLTLSTAPSDGDTVTIDDVYYEFTGGSVDAGTPDGTLANPWLVANSLDASVAVTNLYDAINDAGGEGVTYSTATTAHPTVFASNASGNDLFVAAKEGGIAGDGLAVSETGSGMAWATPTLENGGSASLLQVRLPDGVGAVDVAHLNSFIIVIPEQSEDRTGRYYWVEPGEVTIDPVDFATAERSADPIDQVIVFGDMFWLLGAFTTEPWIATGGADPFQRFQGILFDRGTWEGASVQVKDSLILTDADGAVFRVQGGLQRISPPHIEEQIRKAIEESEI